jgi:hypothetical protein
MIDFDPLKRHHCTRRQEQNRRLVAHYLIFPGLGRAVEKMIDASRFRSDGKFFVHMVERLCRAQQRHGI